MKHTTKAMREMADLVAYPSLASDDIRNQAADMLRDISDDIESLQIDAERYRKLKETTKLFEHYFSSDYMTLDAIDTAVDSFIKR
jgi:hypothetical protein